MLIRSVPLAPQPPSHAACLRHKCRSAWRAPASSRWTQQRRRPRFRCPLAAGGYGEPFNGPDSQPPSSSDSLEQLAELADLNRLQTALNTAIAAEDWELAAGIRDLLRSLTGTDGQLAADWHGLGIRGWLADRAESMGFNFPTEVQKRATPVILDGDDCIIQSETGSGKTLAFLLPLLSRLSYPPHTFPDDLKGPAAVIVVPTRELGVQLVMLVYRLYGGSVNPGVPGLGGNLFDFHGPRGLKVKGLLPDNEVVLAKKEGYLRGVHVLVGTPELIAEALSPPEAVQAVQHVEVLAVDEVDACFQSHPLEMERIMAAACERPQPAEYEQQQQWEQQWEGQRQQQQQQGRRRRSRRQNSSSGEERQGSSSEEGREQWEAAAGEEEEWERQPLSKPVVILVGATLEEPLIEHVVEQGWVSDPVTVRVGGRMRIPSGLQHRCIVVAHEAEKVAAMTRQIRADLRGQSDDAAPARVMVFAGSQEQARQLSDPLRTVLWGDHKISVLLPEGTEPIKALHSFRDNKTTLLLATPAAARGLDLPAVSHVYNIELPLSPADYLHRAGRSGRIGSAVQGIVTTLVTRDELPQLERMAAELGVTVEEQASLPPELPAEGESSDTDVDAARRGLEDLFNLY